MKSKSLFTTLTLSSLLGVSSLALATTDSDHSIIVSAMSAVPAYKDTFNTNMNRYQKRLNSAHVYLNKLKGLNAPVASSDFRVNQVREALNGFKTNLSNPVVGTVVDQLSPKLNQSIASAEAILSKNILNQNDVAQLTAHLTDASLELHAVKQQYNQ